VPDERWYTEEGLRFTCSECGDCCTGAPGFVWVNKAEIEALAKQLEMDVVQFRRRYVRAVGIRKSLTELANGDCIFFDSHRRRCKVYDVRPRQCRTWPFWRSNLRSREAWEATCQACPGSGRGKLYRGDQITAQLEIITV
jgi:Fe-S-cluster containining protein